ncbi:uncharacterized protein LOC134290131 [Aedes albopictus]|uniref:Retrovirus-related Pol polyprotein from transposon TNT 1-94-like beta-barrel domain-containing protein n=1 Tax=Aedes albopictus TaxID=7160 RepID=A0ABM1ZKP5_AEDAL
MESVEPHVTASSSRGSGSRNVCFTTTAKESIGTEGWLIDSGSSMHMTGTIEQLKDVVPCKKGVFLADGKMVSVRATGTCEFTKRGVTGEKIDVKLKNVFYVPGLAANVISVSRMVDAGYDISFGHERCTILDGVQAVFVGERRGEGYWIQEEL